MKELLLKVEGMKCSGCENRIQNSLKEIEGVKKVIAKHKKGTVTVKLSQEINEQEIIEKITNLGFKVVED